MRGAAAETEQRCRSKIREVDVDARTEGNAAAGTLDPVPCDDAANRETAAGKEQRVPALQSHLEEELRLDERAGPFQEVV